MVPSKAPKGDRGTVESPNLGRRSKKETAPSVNNEGNLKTLTKKYMGASNFLKEFYRMQDEVSLYSTIEMDLYNSPVICPGREGNTKRMAK